MKCEQIMAKLEILAPLAYSCEWDNPGLLAGRSDKEVKTVMIALDATDQVIRQAADCHADLLITHHPLIFKPLKQINDRNFISNRILTLIRNDISYYAMHTNFDAAPGCMADLVAAAVELQDRQVLEPTAGIADEMVGIGRIGNLKQPMTLRQVAAMVKKQFQLPYVTIYGGQEKEASVQRAAVSPGAGGSMIEAALSKGAQVLITGDIGHHNGIDAVARGMSIIDAGHYGLEYIFVSFVEQYLKNEISSELIVYKEDIRFPSAVLV